MTTPNDSPDKVLETEPLDDAIEELSTQTDFHALIHATPSAEDAEAIIKEGLFAYVPEIGGTTIFLANQSTNPEAIEKNKRKITEETHKGFKFVVILGVERYKDPKEIPHNKYIQSIIQPREGGARGYRSSHNIIDKRFVRGYFDVEKGLFIKNPDFDPTYDPSLMQTTSDIYIRLARDGHRSSARLGSIGTVVAKHQK